MIIDAHTHIAKLANHPLAKLAYSKIRDLLLKEMRAAGIDHAVVLASSGLGKNFLKTDQILKLTQGVKNLSVVGSIDVPNFGKQDLQQLEGWLKAKKIVAVKLLPGYQYFYPSDPVCRPIYKLCLKYGMPIIFHTGDTYSDEVIPKVKYTHPLHIDDVAVDFPNLKIIIAHMGNPWLVDCAEVMYKNKNVYADLSGLIVPGQQLNSPYGKLMTRRIKELITYSLAPRKLLYGTDWPLAPMKEYVKFVKNLGVAKKDLDYVFYKNAQELFKIKTR